MANLESLLVSLDLDSARFRTELEKVLHHIEEFNKKTAESSSGIESLISFDLIKEGAAALGEFALKGIEAADHMGKLAQSVGVPIEQLSRLTYAGQLTEVSTDQLGHALEKMSRNMAQAHDDTGIGARAFNTLGVAVKDSSGHLRATEEVFLDVADKMSKFEDGAAKAALAQAIFGKSGAELIPLLNKGKAGLQELGAEADKFGLTIKDKAAKEAEEFNENMKRLKLGMQGVAVQVAGQMAPMLTHLSDALLKSAKDGGLLSAAVDGIVIVFKSLITAGHLVSGVMQIIGTAIGGVIASFILFEKGEFKAAGQALKDSFNDILKQSVTTTTEIHDTWVDAANKGEHEGPELAKKLAAPIVNLSGATHDAGKKAIDEIRKVIEGYQEKIAKAAYQAAYGKGDLGELTFRINEGDLSRAFAHLHSGSEALKQKLLETASAWERVEEKAKRVSEAQEATKKLEAEVTRLHEALTKVAGNGELGMALEKLKNPEYVEALKKLDVATRTALVDRMLEAAAAVDALTAKQEEAAKREAKIKQLREEAVSVTKELRTSTEQYAAEVKHLQELQRYMSDEAYARGLARAKQEYFARGGEMTKFTQDMTKSMGDAFADNLFDGFDKGLEAMGAAFVNMLKKMVAQAIAAQLLQSVFGLGPGGGWGTSLLNAVGGTIGYGGARASGGEVQAGQRYLVGEQGPEEFVPSFSGRIVPAQGGSGGGASNDNFGGTRRVVHVLEVADHGNRTLREAWEGFLADEAAAR